MDADCWSGARRADESGEWSPADFHEFGLTRVSACLAEISRTSRLPVAKRPPQPKAASSLLGDASTSPSSRFLASDPAALVTPSHTLFQQPA
jgi:hypothetical protein